MLRGNRRMRAAGIIMLANAVIALGYVFYLFGHLAVLKEYYGSDFAGLSGASAGGYRMQLMLVLVFEVYTMMSGVIALRSAWVEENSGAMKFNGIVMTVLSGAWVLLAIKNHTSESDLVGGSFSESFMIATAIVSLICSQLLILSAMDSKPKTADTKSAEDKNYISPKFVIKG